MKVVAPSMINWAVVGLKLTMPLTSTTVVYRADHQALSTARFCRTGQLAAADACSSCSSCLSGTAPDVWGTKSTAERACLWHAKDSSGRASQWEVYTCKVVSVETCCYRTTKVSVWLSYLHRQFSTLCWEVVDERLCKTFRSCTDMFGWRRGIVVSRVHRMNKVNACRARLVPGWVTVFGRVYHLGM